MRFRVRGRETHAVRDLSVRVERGERLAYIRPNGAGNRNTPAP